MGIQRVRSGRARWTKKSPRTKKVRGDLELMAGFEPATYWLRISCSTSWATPAWHFSRNRWYHTFCPTSTPICRTSFRQRTWYALYTCILRSVYLHNLLQFPPDSFSWLPSLACRQIKKCRFFFLFFWQNRKLFSCLFHLFQPLLSIFTLHKRICNFLLQ